MGAGSSSFYYMLYNNTTKNGYISKSENIMVIKATFHFAKADSR